jgi:hypothetical protein
MYTFYRSKHWTMMAKDKTRITATEFRFMRPMMKYTWTDYKRNEDKLKN